MTINERAAQYRELECTALTEKNKDAALAAYIDGATDQRAIDIKRAVDFIKNLAFIPNRNMNIICEKLTKAMKGE